MFCWMVWKRETAITTKMSWLFNDRNCGKSIWEKYFDDQTYFSLTDAVSWTIYNFSSEAAGEWRISKIVSEFFLAPSSLNQALGHGCWWLWKQVIRSLSIVTRADSSSNMSNSWFIKKIRLVVVSLHKHLLSNLSLPHPKCHVKCQKAPPIIHGQLLLFLVANVHKATKTACSMRKLAVTCSQSVKKISPGCKNVLVMVGQLYSSDVTCLSWRY